MSKIIKYVISACLIYYALPTSLYAQYDFDSLYLNDQEFKTRFDLIKGTYSIFDYDEKPLHVVLISNFRNLIKKKHNREYQEATIQVLIADTLLVQRKLKIEPRGANRLKSCYYPPIKLNFKKSDLLIDQLKEFDKIKLVGTCRNSALYEQLLLNEYLIYKVYQLIEPDFSFRVRLLEVTYIDTSGKSKPRSSPSFLIEPLGQVAARTQCVAIDVTGLNFDHLMRLKADAMAVFQYMIGNTDWSVPGQHNIKIIKPKDHNKPLAIAIPYDFDYTGLVDAPYAVAPESLSIETVRERLYRGYCGQPEDIKAAVELIKDKKDGILSLYQNAPFTNENYKKRAINYLNEFFTVVESDRWVKSEIIDSCR